MVTAVVQLLVRDGFCTDQPFQRAAMEFDEHRPHGLYVHLTEYVHLTDESFE